jgi:universal stress protein E
MRILAATDFSTRSNRALRQAGLLAQSGGAQLHIVHVVDDDRPDALVRVEKREAERLLGEQVDSMPELLGTQARPRVVAGDAFDGILRTAAEIRPDLIVMGSHRKQMLRDIFVGTTIERVIRQGSFPVLMVNFEAQRKYENVIAPVDLSDTSAHALRVARSLGLVGDSGVTFLHAFAALAKGKMFVVGSDRDSIDSYVASERERASGEVAEFLAANDLEGPRRPLRVAEGRPMEVIFRAVSEMRPDLLIMGTRGRSGLLKALIGSVTEEALRSLNVDILAVPPIER